MFPVSTSKKQKPGEYNYNNIFNMIYMIFTFQCVKIETLVRYFIIFLPQVFKMQNMLYTSHISQFGLAAFQAFSSHSWWVTTIVDTAGTEAISSNTLSISLSLYMYIYLYLFLSHTQWGLRSQRGREGTLFATLTLFIQKARLKARSSNCLSRPLSATSRGYFGLKSYWLPLWNLKFILPL